jgi:hypothetical protein
MSPAPEIRKHYLESSAGEPLQTDATYLARPTESPLIQGFSGPSENRGVLGSIPSLPRPWAGGTGTESQIVVLGPLSRLGRVFGVMPVAEFVDLRGLTPCFGG